MNVNELIKNIDNWRTAFVAYKLALVSSPKAMSQERRDALDALDQAAMRVHGCVHQDNTYVAFERLVDEIQRLQQENEDRYRAWDYQHSQAEKYSREVERLKNSLNPDVCRKCGSDAMMLDAASGIRVCRNCGEGQ